MAHSPETSRSFFQKAAAAAAVAVVGLGTVFGGMAGAQAQGPLSVGEFLSLPGQQQSKLIGPWTSERAMEVAQLTSPLMLCLTDAYTRATIEVTFKDGTKQDMPPGVLRLQQLLSWAQHNGYAHTPARDVARMSVDQAAEELCPGRSPNAETAQADTAGKGAPQRVLN